VIKAIIFDFGNVLCSFSVAKFFENLAQRSRCTVKELHDLLPEISRIAIEYETGLITSDQFYRQITVLTKMEISREEFIKAYVDIFAPIESTFDLIRRLKPHYRLGLLSNTNEWHFEHSIKTVSVYPLFDAVSLSYVVGAMKPKAAIYHDMLAKLGVEAGACVYIDDLPENVEAAAKLGMDGIVYSDHAALLRDLRSRGVNTDE